MKNKIFEIYLKILIKLLETFGFAEWTKKINQSKINGRDIVLIEETRRRRLEIANLVVFGKPTRFYRVNKNGSPRGEAGKSCFYETMPLGSSYNRMPHELIDNKWFVKKILWQKKIPTARGQLVSNIDEALRYIATKSYPVVIKPINESRCLGVMINIRNKKELVRAVQEVREYGRKFLIEEFLIGQSYRVTIVNNHVVAACLRKPPQVIGDGIHTISQLIEIKNNHPRRISPTICPIKIDRGLLKEQNLSLKTIPAKNRLIILNPKINLGSGADIVDATEKVNPAITQLCLRVAQIFDARVLGLDIIVPDIAKSPSRKNSVYVIEINSLPFIDMHHFPYEAKPRNVAGAIWDMVLK